MEKKIIKAIERFNASSNSGEIFTIVVTQEFIIADDSTFEQVFTNSLSGQLNCTLPIIDFNNNSLLGLFTTGSCEVKYIREVTRNESEENYHYRVVVKSCGTCKKEGYAYNWVTVPKIPENWNVTFEIENK